MKANYKNQPATLETGMTLYDLNKQLVNQLPTLTKEQLEEKYFLIDEFGKYGITYSQLSNINTDDMYLNRKLHDIALLYEEYESLKKDKSAIEDYAREKYGYKRADEDVFVIEYEKSEE